MPDQNERVLYLREAGAVRRCHAMTLVGDVYNVAVHSFNAVSLLIALNPSASGNLIRALLFHDCGERIAGDIPHPSRKQVWEKAVGAFELLELNALKHYGIGPWMLTEEETQWLNGCDMMEFWLFCMDQFALGNRTVTPDHDNACQSLAKSIHEGVLPQPLEEVFRTLQHKRGSSYLGAR